LAAGPGRRLGFEENTNPQAGYALVTWMSGPVLPVEPWNMALEPPHEGGHGGAHGTSPAHPR
jgi:hypothetical protein